MALIDQLAQNPQIAQLLGLDIQDARNRAMTEGLLGSIFQAAALSGPQPYPVSTAQALGKVGMTGYGAYQQSFDKALKDALTGLQIKSSIAEMATPKYMTIKTPAGGEALIQIPKAGGTPEQVAIPGLDMTQKPIDFDPKTQAFIGFKFGKPYTELNPDQKQQVLEFMNAPDEEKLTSLRIEASKQKFETGETVPIPRGRGSYITGPQPAPIAVEKTAETPAAKLFQVPESLVSKPMGQNEVPIIESAGVSPKQKQELLLARPATQSSVEYVVNTNRAMRNLIQEVLANPGFNDAFGMGGETLSKIPGSPAANVKANLERLGGNLFIDAITALRNASKTGAGVGNATEKEGDKLERSKAALQQFQSADQARSELTRLLKSLEDTEKNVLNSYERTYGLGSFQLSPMNQPKDKRPPLSNIFGGQ